MAPCRSFSQSGGTLLQILLLWWNLSATLRLRFFLARPRHYLHGCCDAPSFTVPSFTVLGPNQSVSCLKQAVSSRLRLRPLTGPFEPLCYTRATESYAGRLPWPLASTSREHVVSAVGRFARLKFGCCDAVLAGCGKRPVRLLIVWRSHTCTVHIPACPRRRHHENSRISGQGNHP